MKALRIAKYVILATFVVAIALGLHYILPRTDVVKIVGTDVKRTDSSKKDELVTRDVRFITSLMRDGKTPSVQKRGYRMGMATLFQVQ